MGGRKSEYSHWKMWNYEGENDDSKEIQANVTLLYVCVFVYVSLKIW